MAYVPPHKRHSDDNSLKPTLVPSSVIPQFKQSLSVLGEGSTSNYLSRRDRHQSTGTRIIHTTHSISRWFTAGVAAADPLPSSVRLEQSDSGEVDKWTGAKMLVLRAGEGEEIDHSPWVKIVDRVMPDLAASYLKAARHHNFVQGVKSPGDVFKLTFVARIGRVLFTGNKVDLETIRKTAATEEISGREVRQIFNTNICGAYVEDLKKNLLMSKMGFHLESEKELYHVEILDKNKPDVCILCKCRVAKTGGALEIYKIELNLVRYLVVNVHCLYKDFDLRFMLYSYIKKSYQSMGDEAKEAINLLVQSSVVDPGVKGGLRWPLGKTSSGDRFRIVGSWKMKEKIFYSQTMNIQIIHADRFDHRTSTGQVTNEVTFKLTRISKQLTEPKMEPELIREMLQGAVEVIWNNFLSYNCPLTELPHSTRG